MVLKWMYWWFHAGYFLNVRYQCVSNIACSSVAEGWDTPVDQEGCGNGSGIPLLKFFIIYTHFSLSVSTVTWYAEKFVGI